MSKSGWKPIPGTGGTYEVDANGQVRSWRRGGAPRVLKPWPKGPKGHLAVRLRPVGHPRRVALVHRLILETFVGPCPEGMEVRHLDGNSSNNRLLNLAYGTASENARDQLAHGTHHNANKTRCKRGHEFTTENTYVSWQGYRTCRACVRLMTRARKAAA